MTKRILSVLLSTVMTLTMYTPVNALEDDPAGDDPEVTEVRETEPPADPEEYVETIEEPQEAPAVWEEPEQTVVYEEAPVAVEVPEETYVPEPAPVAVEEPAATDDPVITEETLEQPEETPDVIEAEPEETEEPAIFEGETEKTEDSVIAEEPEETENPEITEEEPEETEEPELTEEEPEETEDPEEEPEDEPDITLINPDPVTYNGVTVTVSYPSDTFGGKDVTLVVGEPGDTEKEALETYGRDYKAVDITFIDEEGNPVQPDEGKTVSVALKAEGMEAAAGYRVAHVGADGEVQFLDAETETTNEVTEHTKTGETTRTVSVPAETQTVVVEDYKDETYTDY